jgi:hypothetical protein
MANTTVTTINLTEEDKRIILKLKKQLAPAHGKQTAVGVIRIALRKALQ